jgi:stress-induced morphogen
LDTAGSFSRLTLPDHDVSIWSDSLDKSDALLVLDLTGSLTSFKINVKSIRFLGLNSLDRREITATMMYSECASFQRGTNRPRRTDG